MKAEHVGRCDHVKAKRNRKQTFVVLHDNGTMKAVGRQCIKDFLGHTNPNHLASWAECLVELGNVARYAEDEEWLGGGGGREVPHYDLEYFLGWVAGATRVHGWMSRTRAHDGACQATVDHVDYLLDPPSFTGRHPADTAAYEKDLEACRPTDADKAEAGAALEWALGLDIEKLAEGANTYLANVAALARAGVVEPRTWGLGGSIVAAYARARDLATEKAALPESRHVGTPKGRDSYRVRVEKVIPNEGAYGLTLITKMLAWDEGREMYANDMVWFASTEHELKEGGEYLVKATVRQHGEFNGRLQTIVNRVNLIGVVGNPT